MTLQDITEKMSSKAAAGGNIGNTVKFVFTGGEGVVFLDGNGGVHNENATADCTVNVAITDMGDMLSGDLNPMSAFMGGKMQIDGDMSVAMKLSSIFA